ncbi:MAG: helix-turn-helix domain-containing protein [Bacteroidota bacterium]
MHKTEEKMKSSDYQQAMERIEVITRHATEKGGFIEIGQELLDEYLSLASYAASYEDKVFKVFPIKEPTPLVLLIEEAMHKRRMKQRDLARELDVSEARISDILRGKANIGMTLAKKIHKKLGIDGNLILENA